MDEEKKEEVSEDAESKDEKSEEEEVKTEETKEDFVKEEVVPTNKYNQTLRKLREAELEKKELEKKLQDKEPPKEEEEDVFKEEKEDPNKLIDEKLKPVFDTLKKREENDRKIDRDAFFEAHPLYLNNGKKFQELLDKMDEYINPNSNAPYYEQLEATHRILAGDTDDVEVENKKTEIAGDTTSDGAEKGSAKEEFTAEDRKHMKEFNVSIEGMRAYKEKIKSGSMRILS